ncbi:MAG: response regulator [Ignavibacteriales bacterium]|nr:response regulator [Ignavibacteriales bacterium]
MTYNSLNPEAILESISGGFFALDKDFKFTYWNKAAAEGTRLKREEVIGKSVFEVFPNLEKSELGEKYRRAFETKTFQSFVNRYRDDVMEKWFDFRIYPNVDGLSVFLQDITEQKRQERQREMLLRISHAINSATQLEDLCAEVVYIIANNYALPQQNVLLYFHRPHDEQLILLAPELPLTELQRNLYAVSVASNTNFASVESFQTGSKIVTTDISRSVLFAFAPEKVVSTSAVTLLTLPLRVERERLGVLEVLLNQGKEISEHEAAFLSLVASEVAVGISRRGLIDELRVKNVDLEIQRAQTQEAHDKLKRFLAFFSHELRAPLNSIIGFSDLINEDIEKMDREKLMEYNTAIKSSGTHLLHLINDILDLSKIEAGKLELHYAPTSIRQLFESVKQTAQPLIDSKKIQVETHVDDELDEVIADGVRLKQVLINLATNALKFSHPEGKVILNAKRMKNEIEISIQDFGVGIKKDEIQSLFQPFQQTADGAKKTEGTGLGLAITKKIVELHGGSLFVVSEFGEGSTFIARLPILVQVENEAETVLKRISDATDGGRQKRVLIVEDKPHARTLLHTYLTEAGYVTEIAANGVEAMEKAKLWKPDVITLDILLPVKDGWQVLRELKDHPLCKDIPVIIISMVDERNVGFGLGAVEYFVKPVQKNDLLAAIKKVEETQARKSAKILVIDDDKSVTDLIQVILESEGCVVLKAQNGKEGLVLAEKEKPDLIILDLVMPELSGFNVAYQLKHNPATYTIPVMIMTSMEIDDETREQLQGFVVSLMRKSGFTKRDLLNEIASIEGKKQ